MILCDYNSIIQNMNTLESSIINPTNEFHVLRHFKFVNNSYKKMLINQPYWYYNYTQKKFLFSKISQNDVTNALETVGTKFEKNISGIENPNKLLKIIEQKFQELLSTNKIHWIDSSENKIAEFRFNYKINIGKINCLPIEQIPKANRRAIECVLRSNCIGENNITVNTISEIELSYTKTIFVEVKKIKQLPFYLVTTFPDCSVPNNLSDDELVFVI